MRHAWLLALAASTVWLVGCGVKEEDTADTDGDTDTLTTAAVQCPLRWDCDDGAVRTFFEIYCSECHDTPPMDFTNYADVRDNSETIRCGVTSGQESLAGCGSSPKPGQFPQGDGPQPAKAERDLIVDWIEAGALE